jgi:hypothetical protein
MTTATFAAGCMASPTEADIVRSIGVRLDGTVTDGRTGAPISGATVTTQGVSKSTFANGMFLFLGDAQSGDGLRTGVFPVVVSHEGYVVTEQDVTFLSSPNVVNFELQPTSTVR